MDVGSSMNDDTYSYDPDRILQEGAGSVNLSDPDELEAHLQVLDIRQRLRQRRRRMIRLFSVAFLLLVAALLVGMGLTTKTGKRNAALFGSGNDDSNSVNTGSTTQLPPPPADLGSKCSATSITSTQGIQTCEEACEVADCCSIPEGFALSCLASNTAVCTQYQRYCNVLNGIEGSSVGFVPPPEQGVGGGGSAAEPISSPGEAIAPSVAPIAPTPMTLGEQIDQACGELVEAIIPPGDGEDVCETLCASSVCCFNQYCIPSLDVDCLEFAGCYVLYTDLDTVDDDTTTNDGSPTLVDEIHEACFTAGTITDAIADTECIALCAPAACCFETNLECVDVSCATYAECNILYPSYLAISRDEVDDACQNHRDAASGSSPSLCEQVCALHVMQCCFHGFNDESCANALQQPGTAYCDTYTACEILGTSSSELRDSLKDELQTACDEAQTRSHCITLCAAATCCYATTIAEECANVDATIDCDDYSACDVLYNS